MTAGTLVVDASGAGDHRTIAAAIRAAPPNTRILIRPGTYREGVGLLEPLELVGDGPPGSVVVEAFDLDVILSAAPSGRVANLTLRQVGGGHEGEWYAVDLEAGALELVDCDISSESLACVAIHDGADPVLRRNRIHHGRQGGVMVFAQGLGTLEDNDIDGNGSAGVTIRGRANPTLRRNRVHHNRRSGVLVHDDGLGLLEDNDIDGNGHSGVWVATGGSPTLRGNRIHDNAGCGIFADWNAAGLYEVNAIYANGQGAFSISRARQASVILRGNTTVPPDDVAAT